MNAAQRFTQQGGTAEVVVLDGDGGHLEFLNIAKQGDAIRAFLAK